MRRQIFGSTGRRGTAIVASAAALCLGSGFLAACGSGPGDDGYVAVGAAADSGGRAAGGDGKPSGEVTLVPLDGNGGSGGGSGERGPGGHGSGNPSVVPSSPGANEPGRARERPGGARTETPGGRGDDSPGGPGGKPSTPANPSKPGSGSGPPSSDRPGTPSPPGDGTPSDPGTPKPPAPPATPAALTLSAPQRAAADKRWCEKVTVEFRNTGGSTARSGTVTFATHIIGALGVDWATITSSQPLPAPIGVGSARSETYTVCVESWRVPLGMRVETQDVSAVWK
ncbi:hypothetical protein [Streptomyces sp. rh34]|uniref:hypothetical protein n=1 Tax=Streptomyces sp. rh34 TaxID=2034272 RepID=UPI000BF23D89|nr:hypothetical protein [Streptomyces sp. rh34]